VKLGNVAPRPLVVVQESKETNLICNVVVVDASHQTRPNHGMRDHYVTLIQTKIFSTSALSVSHSSKAQKCLHFSSKVVYKQRAKIHSRLQKDSNKDTTERNIGQNVTVSDFQKNEIRTSQPPVSTLIRHRDDHLSRPFTRTGTGWKHKVHCPGRKRPNES